MDSPSTRRVSPGRLARKVQVVIEIPRGSFMKRGSSGALDFISPLPCPFNYGSIPQYIGLEGDLLDAVVLGPRLDRGTRITVTAFGAVGMTDRGLYDDKLICAAREPSAFSRRMLLLFFHLYAKAKGLLNLFRGQSGVNVCEGWGDAESAIRRARPHPGGVWKGPDVDF